jgi:hypothetical protein
VSSTVDLQRVRDVHGVSVRVWLADASHVRADAILCGAISAGNPLDALFEGRGYWTAGLAQGPTAVCPPRLYEPSDEVRIVEVDRDVVAARAIGIVNPRGGRSGFAALFEATVRALAARPHGAHRFTFVSPWRGGELLFRTLREGFRRLLASQPDGMEVLNLVDHRNADPYLRMLEEL